MNRFCIIGAFVLSGRAGLRRETTSRILEGLVGWWGLVERRFVWAASKSAKNVDRSDASTEWKARIESTIKDVTVQ